MRVVLPLVVLAVVVAAYAGPAPTQVRAHDYWVYAQTTSAVAPPRGNASNNNYPLVNPVTGALNPAAAGALGMPVPGGVAPAQSIAMVVLPNGTLIKCAIALRVKVLQKLGPTGWVDVKPLRAYYVAVAVGPNNQVPTRWVVGGTVVPWQWVVKPIIGRTSNNVGTCVWKAVADP